MADEIKTENVAGEKPLTETEVLDVLEFVNAYYRSVSAGSEYGSMAFTPYLTNERLSQIGLRPESQTKQSLESAFAAPISNQKTMVGYAEFLKLTDMVSKRTMLYLGNLPSFDYTFVPINVYDDAELDSPEYKRDLAKVREFSYRFDAKGQMSYAARRMLESDAFYGIFRDDGENFVFQELPADYCLITGRNSDWGFTFDFDMNWFLQQGLSIDQYPPQFTKMWKRVFGNLESLIKYNPANGLKKRKGKFSTWAQTSPLPAYGGFVCFKFNSDNYATIPYIAPMFADAINKPLMRTLQTNRNIISAQKMMIGLIPLLKDQKSGQVSNALAVDPKIVGSFLGMIKSGLSEAFRIGAAPFSDIKDVSVSDSNDSIYANYNSDLSKQAGVTGSLIYGSERPTATEIQYSAQIDAMIATSIYAPMAKWMSAYVNTLTEKYKFKFSFEGTKYEASRKERLDNALKLANAGIVLPQKIAAANGMNVFEMEDQIKMGRSSGFKDMLYLLPNANTASLGGEAGRPELDASEASESTLSKLDRV